MAEAFSWREGQLRIWTGTSSAYVPAYMTQGRANETYGWNNKGPTLGGDYHDILTGQRVDVSMQAAYTYDITVQRMAAAKTAVHMELYQSSVNGSAGIKLWSGRIDAFSIQGSNGATFSFSMNYHTNIWSAYGG